ncbi:MAG: hypothetical protein R3F55_20365 [Alphaproteobacteria bacterium]
MSAAPAKAPRRRAATKGATSQKAPAASLSGMRLWKADGQETAAAAKPGMLTGLAAPAAEAEPAPARTPLALVADAPRPTLTPVVVSWQEALAGGLPVLTVDPADHENLAPHPTVMLVEGGLPEHVSPFPQRARDESRRDSDILGYWARIAGARPMPAWRDLDANQIAYFWPNSFLLACKRGNHGRPLISRATRIVDNDGMADRSADIAFTPQMVAWIVRVSLDVARVGEPLGQDKRFVGPTGHDLDCEMVALPLGEEDGTVSHVLCHVKARQDAHALTG